MEFNTYSSIENSYRDKFLEKVRFENYQGKYQITEKLHGANFSFYSDGEEIKTASRNQFVEDGFYNSKEVTNKILKNISDIFEGIFSSRVFNVKKVVIYGELCGDGVQSGIKYGPKDFYVFDILVSTDDDLKIWLLPSLTETLCNAHSVSHAPILEDSATLEEALSYNVDFNSKILGLEDNLAEGIVIKPREPYFLHNGSRVILKKKSEKFSENNNKAKVRTSPLADYTEEMTDIFSNLLSMLTENRTMNSVSKIGEIDQSSFGKLLGEMSKDCLKDYPKDFGEELETLEKGDFKRIKKDFNKKVLNFIRPIFLKLINN
jgi:Rnl2 family RNA ligase